jgi:hypothetical protein
MSRRDDRLKTGREGHGALRQIRFPVDYGEFEDEDDAAGGGDFVLPQEFETELLEDVLGCCVAFFHVGEEAREAEARECQMDQRARGFGGKASSPIGLGEDVTEIGGFLLVWLHFGGAQTAASDVLPFFFQNCGPKAVGVCGLAEILGAEAIQGFFERPRRAAHVTPDGWVCVHANKIVLILRFMGSEEQAVCFEERHADGEGYQRGHSGANAPSLRRKLLR